MHEATAKGYVSGLPLARLGKSLIRLRCLSLKMPRNGVAGTSRSLATDISTMALGKARKGQYSQFEIQRGLPVMLMLKYFDQVDGDWLAKPEVRKMVNFAQHNQLDSARHLGQFDIILCRNMLMYLCEGKRREVLDKLTSALASEGVLMLGAAETVIGQTDKFSASKEFRGFYIHSKNAGSVPLAHKRIAV